MYIEPYLRQRHLIIHLEHSFILICLTKVYSSHRLLTDTIKHIIENDQRLAKMYFGVQLVILFSY